MLEGLIYALVIVGSGGQETLAAHFPNRELCLAEARKVIEQGPAAYCFPSNQLTQEDIQRQFDEMMVLMKRFRSSLEKEQ